ncbi:MAG: hypothetical protein AUJ51_08375 [Elusimicrobia bacterium CG1_02_56_21]|nr:MAG: hypothetical protein AUJ51_08375 [Elusimicrobia bacterium CG1_02_56_21]
MIKTPLLTLLASLAFSQGAFALGVSFDRQGDLAAFARSSGIPPAVPGLSPAAPADTAPGFCVFNANNGAAMAGREVLKTAAQENNVLCVGESHDQLNDHLAQLEALKVLNEVRGSNVVVGFEMLNMTLQPVLDEYASGKITEAEFLKKAGWQKEWGFDFNLYKPLFDFIREKKLGALALNLPKKVVSNIAKLGLDGLSQEDRKYLPADLQVTANAQYIAYIRESFQGHMADMFKFENYLAAMSAWNETMGARMADFINANPGYSGLVVAGSGHVIFNAGIPASIQARAPGAKVASFFMQGSEACPSTFPEADLGLADYAWYVRHTGPEKKFQFIPLLP